MLPFAGRLSLRVPNIVAGPGQATRSFLKLDKSFAAGVAARGEAPDWRSSPTVADVRAMLIVKHAATVRAPLADVRNFTSSDGPQTLSRHLLELRACTNAVRQTEHLVIAGRERSSAASSGNTKLGSQVEIAVDRILSNLSGGDRPASTHSAAAKHRFRDALEELIFSPTIHPGSTERRRSLSQSVMVSRTQPSVVATNVGPHSGDLGATWYRALRC
jgi:hypothetical protein